MKTLLAAISFLTLIPINIEFDTKTISKTPFYFPIVGLLLALPIAGLVWLLDAYLGINMPIILVIVLFMAAASGALHLDGLADCFDAFFSSRPKDRMLEIMKDSAVGTMGALALIFAIAMKFLAMKEIDPSFLWRIVFVAIVMSRCMMLVSVSLLNYARKDGLGKLFFENTGVLHALWGLGLAFLITFLLIDFQIALNFTVFSLAITILWGFFVTGKIGGGTGDTAGAICEIIEVSSLLFFSVINVCS